MFGRSFKPAKCKTTLRLAISRINLLKNRRESQLKQTRRDLAQLLQSGQEASARIRVEHVMREQNIIGAYEFIELFCELIVARLPIIESQKNCPIDLLEAISSVIFAAPRCADIPELSEIRSHFGLKYGKEFVASAAELRPECGVNRTVIEKLSARAPSGTEKLKIMREIAKEHQIEWDPAEAEKDLCNPPEDLLNGPSKFVGATKIPIEPKKESYQSVSGKKSESDSHVFTSKMPNRSGTSHSAEATHYMAPSMSKIARDSKTSGIPSIEDSQREKRNNLHSSVSSGNFEQEQPPQAPRSEKNTKPADLHQETLDKRSFHSLSSGKSSTLAPRNIHADEYDSSEQSGSYSIDGKKAHIESKSAASRNTSNDIGVSNSKDWNINFKDAASAAQAAAYSAEKASEAAKAAAELSKRNTLQKKDLRKAGATNFSPSSSDDETVDLNNSRITRKPSSNGRVQRENQSSHGDDLSGWHYVEAHSENAMSHQDPSWQSSQLKGPGEIDSDYELPMKSTSRQGSYQWPSDIMTDDNTMHQSTHSNDLSGRHYVEAHSKNALSHQGPSWQSSQLKGTGDIDGDYELPMKSTSRQGSYQWRSDITTDDNTMPSTRKDAYVKRDKRYYIDSEEEKSYAKKDNDFSNSVDGLRPWRTETMNSHSNTRLSEDFHYSFSKKSESADELELDRPENNGNTVSQLPMFDDFPHSVETDIRWSPQNNQQASVLRSNSIAEAYNQLYQSNPSSQPPKRTPPGIRGSSQTHSQYSFSNAKKPLDKDSTPSGNASYDSTSSEDDMNNSRTREKPSSNDFKQTAKLSFDDHDHSEWHSAETHAKNGKPQRNVHHQEEITNADNEYDMSMRRTVRTDLHHQRSNRVYHDGNMPFAEKDGSMGQETDIHNFVEESLSMRGDVVNSRSNTRVSDVFGDSDGMSSESEEEIELEKYNGRKDNRLPLFSNNSGSASTQSKHGNSKHSEKVSTPTSSSINKTNIILSQPNPQLQPLKQAPSGITVSSQTSSLSPSSSGETKAQKENSSRRLSHVHPKLPDYDDLAAKFASMKRQ